MVPQKPLQSQWLNIFIPLYYKRCTYIITKREGKSNVKIIIIYFIKWKLY